MNKIYALYVVLCGHEDRMYILSSKDREIQLPIAELLAPSKLKAETRYIMRNFFAANTYEFAEECNHNFLDIQEEYSLLYIRDIVSDWNENDLCLTYGGISHMAKTNTGLYWTELVFNQEYFGYTTNKSLNLLIDNVFNKTTL